MQTDRKEMEFYILEDQKSSNILVVKKNKYSLLNFQKQLKKAGVLD